MDKFAGKIIQILSVESTNVLGFKIVALTDRGEVYYGEYFDNENEFSWAKFPEITKENTDILS